MTTKAMKEGCVEFTYRTDSPNVEQAVITFRPDLTVTLNSLQLWQTSMMLKALFSPEFMTRPANMPPEFKDFVDRHYQFLENSKRDPKRAKVHFDFIPGQVHKLSVSELKPVYDDLTALTHKVALDIAMEAGLH